MAEQGIDLELFRSGVGQRDQRRRALELIETLANGPLWLAVDHLDDLLERLALVLVGPVDDEALAWLRLFNAELIHQP